MKMKFGFLKRAVVAALTLSVLGSSAALAATENLFGYTVVNSSYSQGLAGAINGDRTAAPTTFTSSTKVTGLNSDPALFNFFRGTESQLVLRQYNVYSPATLIDNKIIDPFASSWTPSLAEKKWDAVRNLHAAATKGNFLYATGYDLGKISVVNMSSGYTQIKSYQFPTDWSAISLPTGASVHGEGLTVVGDYLYALFTVNPSGGYSVYSDSIVVKLYIDSSTGDLYYMGHIAVGKNAFTLDHYNNKLYVCALGGMQNAGSSNADTRLDIIDLSTFTKTTVNKTTSMTGDFRDITIVDANTAYVFLGNYDTYFTNMVGGVYRTSVANLATPSAWTKVSNVNSGGYLWGIYADSNRFWFVKGNQIDIYPGLPASTSDTSTKTFTPGDLGYTGGNLNSAIILAPDQPSGFAAKSASGVAKSFASQSVLAQQARKAAEEAKTGLKTVNGQRILSFN
ncbi:hypothetical protein SPSPH_006790 [Sporomusa sphaeroides DSM 2875]|uniref:Uncharacterized protein n=2 Tax=Sporomusa TaxID=2375 RepID=A0ABM9VZK7_9FIRM|nr:hypothetical protein SPSPH_06480 [Sporomusa sphaeroides DSM 2875]CVK18332.1 hypothetical protein SSPH_00969 [Sporomusa sphaeroides DSM 2875]